MRAVTVPGYTPTRGRGSKRSKGKKGRGLSIEETTRGRSWSLTKLYRPARGRPGNEYTRRLALQKTVMLDLDDVRLRYDYKEVAIAMGFLWEKAESPREFIERLQVKECTAINYRQERIAAHDMIDIAKALVTPLQPGPEFRVLLSDIEDHANVNQHLVNSIKMASGKFPIPPARMKSTYPTNPRAPKRDGLLKKRSSVAHLKSRMSFFGITRERGTNNRRNKDKHHPTGSGSVQKLESGDLAEIPKDFKSPIVALSFEGRSLDEDLISYLVPSLMALRSLKYLELQNNKIGDAGLKHLCRFIKDSESLTDLTLKSNHLGNDGIFGQDGLGNALRYNASLVALDLSFNNINEDGLSSLVLNLKGRKALRFLNVSYNSFRDEGAKYLGELLSRDHGCELVVLVCNGNRLKDPALYSLLGSLKENIHLKKLFLANNEFTDNAAKYLMQLIVLNGHKKMKEDHQMPNSHLSPQLQPRVSSIRKSKAFNTGPPNLGLRGSFIPFSRLHKNNLIGESALINDPQSENFSEDGNNRTLQVVDLAGNMNISDESLSKLKNALEEKNRYVFELIENPNKFVWTPDAWVLAGTHDGAVYIAKAINLLTPDERVVFSNEVIYMKDRNQTIMEILISSANDEFVPLISSTETLVAQDSKDNFNEYGQEKIQLFPEKIQKTGDRNKKTVTRGRSKGASVNPKTLNLSSMGSGRSKATVLKSAQGQHDTKAGVSSYNNGNDTSFVDATMFASSFSLFFADNTRNTEKDFLNAIIAIYEVGKFDLDLEDSTGRSYREALEHHRDKNIRNWAKKLEAFDSQYIFDEGAPIHKSTTCTVRFATEIDTDKKVALKIMHNDILFDNEKNNRDLLGRNGDPALKAMYNKYILDYSFHNTISFSATNKKKVGKNRAMKDLFSLDVEQVQYLVLPRMERSLFDVINTEQMAGYDIDCIKTIAQAAAKGLNFMNTRGLMHGDFKPRNILRTSFAANEWKLIDLDASIPHGKPVLTKHSTAYAPPEFARSIFTKGDSTVLIKASESFDVWSFGVVFYELLTGAPLFVANKLDDNLFTSRAKIELMNWLEIGKARLDRVMNNDRVENVDADVSAAKDLLKLCLQANPEDRPTFRDILNHEFFLPPKDGSFKLFASRSPMKTHFFLSHVQVQAAGTVKDIFYSSQNVGCISWLDMEAGDLTVDGMKAGVDNSACFLQVLTRNTLDSSYCVLELLWALDVGKKIVVVVEMEERAGFYPFDLSYFLAKWSDQENLRKLASNIMDIWPIDFTSTYKVKIDEYLKKFGSTVDALMHLLEFDVKPRLVDAYKEEKLIPYRRRNYETLAMQEKIMKDIEFVTPAAVYDENEVRRSQARFEYEKDRLKNVKLVVMLGSEGKNMMYREMLELIRTGLKQHVALRDFDTQWLEFGPDESFNEEEVIKNPKERCVYLLLLTPGFFLTKHGESIRRLEAKWKKNDAPVVVIQKNWFAQPEVERRAELDSGNNYESITLHTEIMPYRHVSPRPYEHEAMLKEASRRISRIGRRRK